MLRSKRSVTGSAEADLAAQYLSQRVQHHLSGFVLHHVPTCAAWQSARSAKVNSSCMESARIVLRFWRA